MKPVKILGIVLLIGGLALLVFGVVQFVEFRDSLEGRISSFGNQLSKSLGGSSKVAGGYTQPILLMVSGAVAGVAGFFLSKRS